jgi:hypothetical protein
LYADPSGYLAKEGRAFTVTNCSFSLQAEGFVKQIAEQIDDVCVPLIGCVPVPYPAPINIILKGATLDWLYEFSVDARFVTVGGSTVATITNIDRDANPLLGWEKRGVVTVSHPDNRYLKATGFFHSNALGVDSESVVEFSLNSPGSVDIHHSSSFSSAGWLTDIDVTKKECSTVRY